MALSFSSEQLNCFRICHVVTKIIPGELRIVFKHEWDVRYGRSHSIWNDTAQNGWDFDSLTTPKEKKRKSAELNVIRNGNTMEWDSTCLIYAILLSNCIGNNSLDPTVSKSIETLREFRNNFIHRKDDMITEADFQSSIQDVITVFEDLKIDTSIIEEIKKQTYFPTESLHELQNQLDEERRKNKEAQSFCIYILHPNQSHETIDRVTEVSEIYSEIEILRNNNKEKVTVTYLSGNPGCGKSELARQIGEKYVDEFEADTKCVMTLDASSTNSLLSSYIELASYLQCSETSINEIVAWQKSDEDKIIRLQKEFINRELLRYSSWLIIVDNVEELKLVSKLIPHAGQTGKGHILITTQDSQSIPPSTSHFNHFPLSEGMKPDDAVNTLSTISKVVDDKHILLRVAKEVSFQPLALACAAMWMQDAVTNDQTANWTTFLHKLYEGSLDKMERVYEKKGLQYKKTMTVAIKMALEVKVAGSEIMKYVFQFLSTIGPERIPMEYIVNYVMFYLPDEDRHSIASEIRSSSFILTSEDNSISIVRVHQIIHHTLQVMHQNETRDLAFWLNILKVFEFENYYCKKRADNVNVQPIPSLVIHLSSIINHVIVYFKVHKIDSWQERLSYLITHFNTSGLTAQYQEVSNCLMKIFSYDSDSILQSYDNIFQYCLTNLPLSDQLQIILSLNAVKMSVVLRNRGQFVLAKNLLENASVIAMLPWLEALILSYLALVITQLGHYTHARNVCERALDITNSKLDEIEYYSFMFSIQNNIGVVLIDLGEYKQSKNFLSAALKSHKNHIAVVSYVFQILDPNQIFGQLHENTKSKITTTLTNLSFTLQELGEYDQALDLLDKALMINEGRECENVNSLRIRALVLQGLGQYHEARTQLKRAIAIQEDKETAYDNNNNPWLARMWRNLASILQDLGQYLQAKDLLERALAIEESICHPNLASTLSSLASVLHDIGKYDQAETLLTRAIDIQERTFKNGHPNMAITLCILASVSQRLGKYENAKSHLEKAMEIQKRTFDVNHPRIATTFTIYASVLRDLGRYEEAKEHLERVIAVQEEVLDKEHPSLAYALCNLASVLQNLGQHEKAICHLERARFIQEKAFQSDDHPRIATTLGSLALNVQGLGRYTEAKILMEKALAIKEKAFDKDHPTIANTLQTLASVLQDLGDYKQAKILLERALAIQDKVFDKDHPYLASTLSNLSLVSQKLDDDGQANLDKKHFQSWKPPMLGKYNI